MNTVLLALKSKICGFEHTSRKFRSRIAKSEGAKRWQLQFRKHELGAYTREHLIAYGLIRKTPYEKIEAKCDERNPPRIDRILEIIHAHVPYLDRGKWTKVTLEKLLERSGERK